MFVLSTGSLHNYAIQRTFSLAHEVGFDGVEVIVDPRWDTHQPDYLNALRQSTGTPIRSIHAPFLTGIDGWEEDPVRSVEHGVELARAVGARLVVAHLSYRWHWIGLSSSFSHARFVLPLPVPRGADYARWLLECEQNEPANGDVRVAVENMPARHTLGVRWNPCRFNRPDELLRFRSLVLDTTHVGTWDWDLLDVYERCKSRVVHLHLSDYDGREHRLPGSGRLPLAELLRRMACDGYQGMIVLETGPQALCAGNDANVRQRLGAALAFCREHFRPQA